MRRREKGKEGHAFLPSPQGVEKRKRKRKCHWRKVAEEKGGPASDENGSLEITGEGGIGKKEFA